MTFTAKNLPKGLTIDSQTGIITGKIDFKGSYEVTLNAKNAKGSVSKKLKIESGDRIALTPTMGWNSWNCFGHEVSADKVKRAADALLKQG
jgi:alpha-galactosidase